MLRRKRRRIRMRRWRRQRSKVGLFGQSCLVVHGGQGALWHCGDGGIVLFAGVAGSMDSQGVQVIL